MTMNEFNEKQIEILQVAERLFAEEGYDGTSIRDISKEANINIAMISYYFGSKEKLLESLVLYRIRSMKLHLENLYQENISPLEKIDKVVELYINRIYKNRCIYQILHFEFSNKKRGLNLDSFTQVKKENFDLLKNIIEEGQQKGFFQTNIDLNLISPIIIGTLTYFQMNKNYFINLLDLKTEEEYEHYIKTTFTKHIQKTIKAFLVYEN
jgi:AcrR family transcriptional regulator